MTRLLLIRHAESVWNAQGRWQGRADPPLSETGRSEAQRAAEALRGQIDVVFASPQQRARDTAAIIASALGLGDVVTDDGLMEVDVGAFSGLKGEEVEERYPEELAGWLTRGLDVVAPGGESRAEMLVRAMDALGRIAAAHEGKRVLVLSHGGVIATLERVAGSDPRSGVRHLAGRWFEFGDGLRADRERVSLIADRHDTAPEGR